MREKTPRELVHEIEISTEIARRTTQHILDNGAAATPYCNQDELLAKLNEQNRIIEASRWAIKRDQEVQRG